MVKNAYIHIPFCKQKCNYCSFVSFPKLAKQDEYIDALTREIKYFYNGEQLNTLYIGGGTPSVLTVENIKKLLKLFRFDDKTEITLEANPETVTKEYLIELKQSGVNRLSFGCQTFNPNILKIIGRKHTPQQVRECVKSAQDTGVCNINLDLIYGLPTQTVNEFEKDLNNALSLGIQHISLYGLKIDEGCYFYKNPPENLPDNDTQADMYLKAIEILTSNGFKHYEISNFALENYHSKHNINYWNNNSYYGFGVSAHGYTGKIRYYNTDNLDIYITNPIKHEEENILTKQEQLEEEIFLGFRKMNGINTKEINKKYSIDFENKYKDILKKYLSYGHITKTNEGYCLSNEGILVSNTILSEFLQ